MSISRLVSRKTETKPDTQLDPFEARLSTLSKTSAQVSGRPLLFSKVRKSPSHQEA